MRYERQRKIDDAFIEAVTPLLQAHFDELETYRDIPLEPDWAFYEATVRMDVVHVFTARMDDSAKLVGYAAFAVQPNRHSKDSMQAACDLFYMDPKARSVTMAAHNFLKFCEQQLKAAGAEVIHHRYKMAYPALGRLLKMLGYEDVEITASRRP